jgi:endonuclease YncB( thermonuclease family)
MNADNYTRRFLYGRVIDGDTITEVNVDLGYHTQSAGITYRIARINTPERHKPTLEAGNQAKEYTITWLLDHEQHGGLYATTTRTDDFGRYLAEIECGAGHNLSDDLLTSGNAVLYKAK